MNVSCSSCPAKYAVPDEKVRGKKVRITCKRCGAAIIVDGTSEAPAAGPSADNPDALSMPAGVSVPAGSAAAAPAATGAAKPAAGTAPRAVERVRHKTMLGGLQASANSAPGAPAGQPGAAAKPAQAAPAAAAPAASKATVPRTTGATASSARLADTTAKPPAATTTGASAPAEPAAAARVKRTEPALAARPAVKEPPTPEAPKDTGAKWTVAVTEEDHREVTVPEVVELYATGVIDSETFVWREGMADWLTPFEIPEIEGALTARGFSADDDANDPGRASGSWREPGRWDAPRPDGEPGFDEVTVAMEGHKARALVEAAGSFGLQAKPTPAAGTAAAPLPIPASAGTDTNNVTASAWTAEAAPYSPGPAPAAPLSDPESAALSDLLTPGDAPTPALASAPESVSFTAEPDSFGEPPMTPFNDSFSTAALPLVANKAPSQPPPAEAAATGSSPRAAVSPERSRPKADLFSKEALASREQPRARMPSVSPEGAPPPRARMASIPPEPTAPANAPTGARNESSVLFSLDALAGKNKPKAPKAPERADENDLLMGSPATSDGDAPPSVANLQNAALFNTMTMAVPDFAKPPVESAPSNPAPAATGEAPKESAGKGGLWVALAFVALIAGGAAAYFLLYPKYVKPPEPTTPVVTSEPTQEPAPVAQTPSAEPAAVAPSTATSAEAVPSAAASAPAGSATAAATPSASAAAAPPAAVAPGTAKPLATAKPAETKPAETKPAETKPAEAKPAEAKPDDTAAAAADGPPFDKAAASEALNSAAAAAVSQCASQEGTHGSGKVTVTFVNSGRATNALVSGDFAGSALGGCVAKVFRGAKVPPFGGETVRVNKGLTIP